MTLPGSASLKVEAQIHGGGLPCGLIEQTVHIRPPFNSSLAHGGQSITECSARNGEIPVLGQKDLACLIGELAIRNLQKDRIAIRWKKTGSFPVEHLARAPGGHAVEWVLGAKGTSGQYCIRCTIDVRTVLSTGTVRRWRPLAVHVKDVTCAGPHKSIALSTCNSKP